MIHSSQIDRMHAISVRGLLGLLILSTAGLGVQAIGTHQKPSGERIIKMTAFRSAPVEVVDVTVANTSYKGTERITLTRGNADLREFKVNGDSDWLSHLKFTIKNTSAAPIVALTLDLLIFDSRLPVPLSVPLSPEKRVPLFLDRAMSHNTKLRSLAAGEQTTYSLNQAILGMISRQLEKTGIDSVSDVELDFGRIQLDFDTAWEDGEIFRRDQSNQDLWRPEPRQAQLNNLSKFLMASYVPGSGSRSLSGCNSSADDLGFHCWDPGIFYCESIDQYVSDEYGSYYLQTFAVTCRDIEGQPCNTEFEFASRRRFNGNCVI